MVSITQSLNEINKWTYPLCQHLSCHLSWLNGVLPNYEGGKEFSDHVRDAVKLEIPWGSTSSKVFGRVLTNTYHLRHLPQYEAQQRIIKKQRTGRLCRGENVNPSPMWNDEMGDNGKSIVETKWEEDVEVDARTNRMTVRRRIVRV